MPVPAKRFSFLNQDTNIGVLDFTDITDNAIFNIDSNAFAELSTLLNSIQDQLTNAISESGVLDIIDNILAELPIGDIMGDILSTLKDVFGDLGILNGIIAGLSEECLRDIYKMLSLCDPYFGKFPGIDLEICPTGSIDSLFSTVGADLSNYSGTLPRYTNGLQSSLNSCKQNAILAGLINKSSNPAVILKALESKLDPADIQSINDILNISGTDGIDNEYNLFDPTDPIYEEGTTNPVRIKGPFSIYVNSENTYTITNYSSELSYAVEIIYKDTSFIHEKFTVSNPVFKVTAPSTVSKLVMRIKIEGFTDFINDLNVIVANNATDVIVAGPFIVEPSTRTKYTIVNYFSAYEYTADTLDGIITMGDGWFIFESMSFPGIAKISVFNDNNPGTVTDLTVNISVLSEKIPEECIPDTGIGLPTDDNYTGIPNATFEEVWALKLMAYYIATGIAKNEPTTDHVKGKLLLTELKITSPNVIQAELTYLHDTTNFYELNNLYIYGRSKMIEVYNKFKSSSYLASFINKYSKYGLDTYAGTRLILPPGTVYRTSDIISKFVIAGLERCNTTNNIEAYCVLSDRSTYDPDGVLDPIPGTADCNECTVVNITSADQILNVSNLTGNLDTYSVDYYLDYFSPSRSELLKGPSGLKCIGIDTIHGQRRIGGTYIEEPLNNCDGEPGLPPIIPPIPDPNVTLTDTEIVNLSEKWILKLLAIYSTFVETLKTAPTTNKLLNYIKIQPADMASLRKTPMELNGMHIVNFFDAYNILFYGKANMNAIYNYLTEDFINNTIEKYAVILPAPYTIFNVGAEGPYTMASILYLNKVNLKNRIDGVNIPSAFFNLPLDSFIVPDLVTGIISPLTGQDLGKNDCVVYRTAMAKSLEYEKIITPEDIIINIEGTAEYKQYVMGRMCKSCTSLALYFALVSHLLPNCIASNLNIKTAMLGVSGLYIMGRDPLSVEDRYY